VEEIRTPAQARAAIRAGRWRGPTSGLVPEYVQANLVVLPRDLAFDFALFCQRNPKPCPLLDVTDVGSPHPPLLAPGADLRFDVPKYRIYREGKPEAEVLDLRDWWQPDMVAFLLGCSFTFEAALVAAGIPVRHQEEGVNVPMYITNVSCRPAGIFHGPMVVSMRPIPQQQVVRAVQVTSRFPGVHGAPVHLGDPEFLGIRDLGKPDFGDPVSIRDSEVPVFWACGVTPQAVALEAKPSLLISHSPGHMFISDLKSEELAVL
jgi:uncharacterized protein YcsI (UPF0317 family)